MEYNRENPLYVEKVDWTALILRVAVEQYIFSDHENFYSNHYPEYADAVSTAMLFDHDAMQSKYAYDYNGFSEILDNKYYVVSTKGRNIFGLREGLKMLGAMSNKDYWETIVSSLTREKDRTNTEVKALEAPTEVKNTSFIKKLYNRINASLMSQDMEVDLFGKEECKVIFDRGTIT